VVRLVCFDDCFDLFFGILFRVFLSFGVLRLVWVWVVCIEVFMASTSAWFGGCCSGWSGLPTFAVASCGSEEGGG
jgi:hypothetical protein